MTDSCKHTAHEQDEQLTSTGDEPATLIDLETHAVGAQAARPQTIGKPVLALLLALIALTVLVVTAWPIRAAIVLEEFNVRAEADRVVLEWATVSEYNIEGFNIYCKNAEEPPSAYHIIGTVPAQGAIDVGFFYTFDVTVLDPGQAYCFRIEEITTDGTAPAQFDRCGFGLNITPTPTLAAGQGAGVVDNTQVTPDAAQDPARSAPVGVDATPTPVTVSPLEAPPTATPVGNSPLGNVVPGVDPNVDAAAQDSGSQSTAPQDRAMQNANNSPLPPGDPNSAAASANESPMLTPTASAPFDPTATATPASDAGGNNAVNRPDTAQLQQGLPTPLYIVLTATPTAAADALAAAPTITPLPTATPASATLLAALSDVSAENILLATLCLVFLGGSGLGILGITSLGLYLRSRTDRHQPGPPASRRRN